MGHGAGGEALEGSGGGVDAERDSVAGQLVLDELVQPLLHLGHAGQLQLPHVIKHLISCWLEVPGVLSHALGSAHTTRAHAAVVSQSPLVQVGMVQSLAHADPLLRVQAQHLTQQVDGLVGGGGSEGVERGH